MPFFIFAQICENGSCNNPVHPGINYHTMKVTAKQLAELLGGRVEGDPDVYVERPARIEEGTAGSLTFLANPKYEEHIYKTEASVVLVGEDFKPKLPIAATLIKVGNVYEAMAQLVSHFDQKPEVSPGIAATAKIGDRVSIGEDVSIGDYVVVGDDVSIGSGCQLHPFVYIGNGSGLGSDCLIHGGVQIHHGCQLGDRVRIHANAVIGSDGFGYVKGQDGKFKKIQQIGDVIIGNDVEIGANVVVDRASLGSTIIRDGVKLDNLIQIAHNVDVGENSAIAAQTGIAGSTQIGPDCLIGGQVGIVGHVKVGAGTEIQAQSGIASDIEPGSRLYGSPALPYNHFLRSFASFKNFPQLISQIRDLEHRIVQLEKKLEQVRPKG